MDECCPMSGVVTSTGVRIAGLWNFSSPRVWTSVVQVALVNLSRVEMLFVLQARSDVSGGGSIWIWQLCPFLTLEGCIEDKHYILSATTEVCTVCATLLHSGHVLESWCVGKWGCIVVQNFKTPLQLLPVTEEYIFSLNGGDVWFWVTVTSSSCLLSPKFLCFHACLLGFSFFLIHPLF